MLRPLAAFAFVLSCGARPGPATPSPPPTDETATSPEASVTAVSVSGEPGAYTFAVTVASDETGCAQYADWWEVVSADGALVYRRILTHSHPSEQPFTRSGGPVAIAADDEVMVRAHLNQGYAGVALTGTVASGWSTEVRAEASAVELETAAPQPGSCLF
ncbi:MAG: hypothetical protein AAF602_02695 [Myxococcota bacterium]